MALFKKEQFEELAKTKGNYCISIYIPTHRGGENKDSMIRLKNRLLDIEKQLSESGFKPQQVKQYLQPVRDLTEDNSVWRHLSDALAVFRSKNKFEYYTLPLDVEEYSLISDKFYLLPLINIFNHDKLFFILLLSLKKNRLYEATQHEVTEIDTSDIFPGDMYDTVGHDVVQKSLQSRGEQTGDGFPLFHGKGEGKEDKKREIFKYLREVDHSLNEFLEDYDIPVVVASVENLFSHFKEVSKNKNLYPECVPGNYDNENILLVHEKALDVLKPYFNKVQNEKKKDYSEAIGKTTSSIEDVVISADAGRIDTLFVAKGKHVWGEYQRKSGKIVTHKNREKDDVDLLDFSARNVLLKDGNVFIEEQEELPENGATVNAILRY